MKNRTQVLEIRALQKKYKSGQAQIEVLRDVNLELDSGDICALVGPSGSGKTSLLGIAVGLEPLSAGEIVLCGQKLNGLSEEALAKLRNENIGFVFQSFQLISSLTAFENIMIPAELRGMANIQDRVQALLERVGLSDRGHHYPSQLSGGEQQRVAIARAFINEPKILFADEPTGNLDEKTASSVEDLLFELHREHGTTLLFATHNMRLASRAQRMLYLENGTLRENTQELSGD